MPTWQRAQQVLAENHHPLRQLALDLVTFGTPIRYGWDTAGYQHLLHFVNHRPGRRAPPSHPPTAASHPTVAGRRWRLHPPTRHRRDQPSPQSAGRPHPVGRPPAQAIARARFSVRTGALNASPADSGSPPKGPPCWSTTTIPIGAPPAIWRGTGPTPSAMASVSRPPNRPDSSTPRHLAGATRMTPFIQVATTTPTRELAAEIARDLVDRRLAACADITGPLHQRLSLGRPGRRGRRVALHPQNPRNPFRRRRDRHPQPPSLPVPAVDRPPVGRRAAPTTSRGSPTWSRPTSKKQPRSIFDNGCIQSDCKQGCPRGEGYAGKLTKPLLCRALCLPREIWHTKCKFSLAWQTGWYSPRSIRR